MGISVFHSLWKTIYHLQEYDIFILGFVGAYLTMLSLLFHNIEVSHEYISKILNDIVNKSSNFDFKIISYNLIWLLYLTAQSRETLSMFNSASEMININGGLPLSVYEKPPSTIMNIFDENDDTYFDEFKTSSICNVPDIEFFKNKLNFNDSNLLKLAFQFLIDDEIHYKINDYLLI